MQKKYLIIILFTLSFIYPISAMCEDKFPINPFSAMNEDEIIIGICSTISPIAHSPKQIVCRMEGNKKVCQERYNPATVCSCRKIMEQMGILEPGESAMSILLNGAKGMSKEEKTKIKNSFNNSFNEF